MTPKASPEPESPPRRRWPWAAAALVFLTALGLGLYLNTALAPLLESIIRGYAADYGFTGLRFDLRLITPWQADVHALQLAGDGPEDENPLRLDSLAIDYSPWGLKARVIKRVRLSGLVLRVEQKETGWRLQGLPDRRTDEMASSARQADRPKPSEWKIRRLEIRNSRLEIRHGRLFSVPFSLTVDQDVQNGERYRGWLHGAPANQSVRVVFELDPEEQSLTLAEGEADLDLYPLRAILGDRTDRPLAGRLAVAGNVRLKLDPPTVETAEFKVWLPDGTASFGRPWGLRVPVPEAPLVSVKLAENRSWVLEAPEFAVGPSNDLRISTWHGRLQPDPNGWRMEGAFDLGVRTSLFDNARAVDADPAHSLPVTYRGQWQTGQGWALNLTGQSASWELNRPPGNGAAPWVFTPRLNITASGYEDRVQIKADAQLTDFKTRLTHTGVRIPAVSVQASGEGSWDRLQGRYAFRADNLHVATASARGLLPRFSIEGRFQAAEDGLRLSGRTRISRGAVRMPANQLQLDGIRLDLPFSWPPDPAVGGGRFRLADLKWNEQSLGAVSGRVRQQPLGAGFEATHQSALIPGAHLRVDGELAFAPGKANPRVDMAYRFERALSREDIDLGSLKANWAGIHGNGRITAEGRGVYESGRLQANLRVEITAGRLVMPEKKAGVLGLEGAVFFPDLTAMRSAPRQQIAFERTYVGDIAATEGQMDFQIEPGGVFFLEQGRFNWCQGTVFLPATRVVPGKDEYDITLDCDRLKLAPLLEQIGAARAEGGGTVNGRIPIVIRRGQFLVNSGFLYSSPGEGGTIRLRGTDMLTAGIPPGTPQYNQLELARQALKEYDYDWVKLSLATAPQEDLLRLKLQLSGRPTNPLPFIYDTRAGGFVPADPGSPGSRFEEIKLDVNFSLPLNRLLEYKDLLNLFS